MINSARRIRIKLRGSDAILENPKPVILSGAEALRSAVEGPPSFHGRRRRGAHPTCAPQKKLEVLRLRSRPPAPAGNCAQDDRIFKLGHYPLRRKCCRTFVFAALPIIGLHPLGDLGTHRSYEYTICRRAWGSGGHHLRIRRCTSGETGEEPHSEWRFRGGHHSLEGRWQGGCFQIRFREHAGHASNSACCYSCAATSALGRRIAGKPCPWR